MIALEPPKLPPWLARFHEFVSLADDGDRLRSTAQRNIQQQQQQQQQLAARRPAWPQTQVPTVGREPPVDPAPIVNWIARVRTAGLDADLLAEFEVGALVIDAWASDPSKKL